MPDTVKVRMVLKTISDHCKAAWKEGENADSFSGLLRKSPVANITQHAFVFLFLAIVIGVTVLVLGEFLDAIPDDGPFDTQLTDIENNIGTGIIVFGIVLIVIPVVAILAYLWQNMGGMAGATNGAGRFRR